MSTVWFNVRNPALQKQAPAARPTVAQMMRQAIAEGMRPAFGGAEIWAAWHRRALAWEGGDDTPWIAANVLSRLPCGECSKHAKAWLQTNPPQFEAYAYFAWTVRFHNAVNERLGRPVWTPIEARDHWSCKAGSLTLQGPV